MKNWKRTFLRPMASRQRQYEVLRAIAVEKSDIPSAAKKMGYSVSTVYSLIRDFKSGKLMLFPDISRGPRERQMPIKIQQLIFDYRSLNLSAADICLQLRKENYDYSVRTVQRILEDAKIPKLNRRTFSERGKTLKNQIISERTSALAFDKLKPFRYDCPVAGVFFFLPYLIESGIIDIVKQCKLPKSSDINAEQACLSMLLLKLMGSERLGHIAAYDHEPGFGIFAGLNFLPKSTFMTTYSCRTSDEVLQDFQQQVMTLFQKKYPDFYQSNVINLDFHSIPHFGDQSKMEKVWCGARSKAMQGANTIFAQDGKSNTILYTRADILHKDEANEIIRFVSYWKAIRQKVEETLVFDCKLTTYGVLDTLMKDKIKFITLRKRNKNLLIDTENIPKNEWQKITISIPKRKHKSCLIHVSTIVLPKCTLPIKQIIITHHGRVQPTYVVTNNHELPLQDILMIYAKRWHIEQKFAELVSFFNLNALSSPLMVRIHFDILWTVIADTLYHRFSQDLPRFEHERADSIFRRFINTPGQIIYDGKEFTLKIRKRAHTPILLGVKKLQKNINIPWLEGRTLKIEWTA